jgi:hypothetical protein
MSMVSVDLTMSDRKVSNERHPAPSFGVVTPHNAQRGALDTRLPDDVTANTVEKYQAVGRDADPAWAGPLGEFTRAETNEHDSVPVRVYPSSIDMDGGDQ